MSSLQDALAKVRAVFAAGTAGDRYESCETTGRVASHPVYRKTGKFCCYAVCDDHNNARAIAAGTCGEDGLMVALVDVALIMSRRRDWSHGEDCDCSDSECPDEDADGNCSYCTERAWEHDPTPCQCDCGHAEIGRKLDALAKVLEVTP